MDPLEGELFTKSICPDCETVNIIPARIYERDGMAMIAKDCATHGHFEDVYWGNWDMFVQASRFRTEGVKRTNPYVTKSNPICPEDCGFCYEHKSMSALTNIVLTNRCDLSCWYCFFYAKKGEEGAYVYEPTFEQVRTMFKATRNQLPIHGNAIQLTGGEPTIRNDLEKIIAMGREEGIEHIQLNTNGIRFAREPDYAQRIRNAGANTIYLSFDGVTPKTNPKNFWEMPSIIENCDRAGIGVVLVPTVIKNMNDHEVGKIVRYAQKNMEKSVRAIVFQPVSLVGRMKKEEREKSRITIPDVIIRMEEQLDGEILRNDFRPVPFTTSFSDFVDAVTRKPHYRLSMHFACGMGTYVFKDKDKLVPITRFVDVDGAAEYLTEKADEVRSGASRYVMMARVARRIGKFIDKEKEPKGLHFTRILAAALSKHDYESLGNIQHKSLLITLMHFMDKYNHDLGRVDDCGVGYAQPDGRIIPFCTFNVIPEMYRDKIQKEFGTPIEEWEKQNGKDLSDDFYKRSRELIANSPKSLMSEKSQQKQPNSSK